MIKGNKETLTLMILQTQKIVFLNMGMSGLIKSRLLLNGVTKKTCFKHFSTTLTQLSSSPTILPH